MGLVVVTALEVYAGHERLRVSIHGGNGNDEPRGSRGVPGVS